MMFRSNLWPVVLALGILATLACTGPEGPTGPQGATGSQGGVGADGEAGPAGPPGVSGYEVVQHSEMSIGNVTTGVFPVQAACPAGKRVIGGGYSVSPADVARSIGTPTSRPSASGNGWVVEFESGSFGTWTFTAFAICVLG